MLRSWSLRKLITLSSKLLFIAILWLGGMYAFEAINKLNILPHSVTTGVNADGNINIWWPTQNARISDMQAFKALVQDKNLSDYKMYWMVDGGQPNEMWDSQKDYPHKEAGVHMGGWNWKGSGPYKVTFKAVSKEGTPLGESSIDVFTPEAAQSPTVIVAGTTTASAQSPSAISQAVTEVKEAVTQAISPTVAAAAASQTETMPQSANINVWWPKTNATITGDQAFKAVADGVSNDKYKMYWQVDNGALNEMASSNVDGAHKESLVSVSNWNWKGTGPYKVQFVAKNEADTVIGKREVVIYTGNPSQPVANSTTPVSTQSQSQNQTQQITQTVPDVAVMPSTSGSNPFSGEKLHVDPNTDAKKTADSWRSSRPGDAYQLDKIAKTPVVTWLGDWNSDVYSFTRDKVKEIKDQGALPVFVAYNIPSRDCGQYSAGGANNPDGYRAWIRNIANGIGDSKAVVILEPDALTLTDCLGDRVGERYNLIKEAVQTLESKPNVSVYIDAGHPGWIPADEMAKRLQASGVDRAQGFALNTSNFFTTGDNMSYGENVARKIGNKHFVIDTGRNGLGPTPDKQWCNPSGRALGTRPTTDTGNSLADAFLWVKGPGGSDGSCNGAPSAGHWWPEYAVELAKRAAY